MSTIFGDAIQRIRQAAGMTLFEVASLMGLSSAFLSAIENGRKRVPDDFLQRWTAVLEVNDVQLRELQSKIAQTRGEVVVPLPGASTQDADLATALARKFSTLSDSQKERMRAILDGRNE